MKIKSLTIFLFCCLLLLTGLATQAKASSGVQLCFRGSSPQAGFAAQQIKNALLSIGEQCIERPLTTQSALSRDLPAIVLLNFSEKEDLGLLRGFGVRKPDGLKTEGFMIRKPGGRQPVIVIAGYDAAGMMYGGLEVAEIIQTSGIGAVGEGLLNPYMPIRGAKFNIPLDVRTPSYSDVSDAAQQNMANMWDFGFWKEYIDQMAIYRYNTISLWNLHPFPSLVKVPEYPDVALDDVHQSTVNWQENYSLNAIGFDIPEIVDNYKVIKRISIEEKMDFWRRVMAYGKSRNIRFFVVTWNVFTNGTFGKYGITDKLENQITRDYFRKSVRQMFLTYPDLAGIGLTTGENMYRYSAAEKEDWAFDTYGKGVLDALEQQPGRKITFIHRQHQSSAREIAETFAPVIKHPDIDFVFSFKYAEAHVYSAVNQVFHHRFVEDIQSAGNLKTLWTLRNDDVYHFRWGAPSFVREFIKNIPYDVSAGYYYGSDQWVWGREFLDKRAGGTRRLEIDKHWYQWMLWGRLGYQPDLSDSRFTDIIRSRFPSVDARQMFDAWQSASLIYPLVTGFHWGALDFQWYIESGQSRPDPAKTPSGYHDVNRFISLPPHRGTGFVSIPDYVKALLQNTTPNGLTPLQLAENIIQNAEKSLAWANSVKTENNKELRQTVDDIRSVAWLGKYYAHKILGATHLAMFRETLDRESFNSAIAGLNTSAGYWRYYSSNSLASYRHPLWTNRVGTVDWRKNYAWALYDITMLGGQLAVPSMISTPGGTVLEAEDAVFAYSQFKNDIPGFTGNGYLETRVGDANHQVDWTYNAPEAGEYILEFRYTLKREQFFPSPVMVNGEKAGEIVFWMTGRAGSWAWERTVVSLAKGENTIRISPEGFVLLDNLNVLKY